VTWETVPFDEAFTDVTSASPRIKQSEFAATGLFPVRDQGEEDVAGYWSDESFATRVTRPLILFGDHTRRVKYAEQDFVVGADGVKVLEPAPSLDPRFAFHWMCSVRVPSAGYSRHFKFLKYYRVPLPPLPEQRRIAAILDEADALRVRASSQALALDELDDGMFEELLGSQVAQREWTLEDVLEDLRYGTSVKSGNTGVPVLRIPNVSGRAMNVLDLKTVDLSPAEVERLRLIDRDVLFVRSNGNPDVVGRCSAFSSIARVSRHSASWVFASYLIRGRLREGVEPEAIVALTRSPHGRRHLRSGAATSAGQYNINTSVLRTMPVFDPSSSKQRDYADFVRSTADERRRIRGRARELDELFASLQHRAFRGEL